MKLGLGLLAAALATTLFAVSALGFGRPCPGPCDFGLRDTVILVAGLMWAGAALRLAFVTVRRLPVARRPDSPVLPIAFGAVASVATVLLTLLALSLIEDHAWPVVTVGNSGLDPASRFYLAGDYAVEWSAISDEAGCSVTARLRGADDESIVDQLVTGTMPPNTNGGGPTTYVRGLRRLAYYVDASSNCRAWSIVLTPQSR